MNTEEAEPQRHGVIIEVYWIEDGDGVHLDVCRMTDMALLTTTFAMPDPEGNPPWQNLGSLVAVHAQAGLQACGFPDFWAELQSRMRYKFMQASALKLLEGLGEELKDGDQRQAG